ncbi:tRNA lysidine(34) synthetase TilS [Enterobacteriaceae bacterium H4N4]|uniref:tRNA(Ile)-lysidine synthase n=1 Tax=Silvania confinis TaxID=2926470 RepID=A0A9J6QD93_9ENTR|nr:tRNA lysidine(34) synthetase TilS [Silvania confinis]MCU6667282.1 tRNA lysidine(34) synthetase TilS [Silvania confinis]
MTIPVLHHAIDPYRRLLVGFSGGLDSTVLLHRLMQVREQDPGLELRAIHIHHGLSPNADSWAAHCENVCREWRIPLIVARVTLVEEGLGIEAQARKARYAAFRDALLPDEALVTAQHQDDQCETFLLALKRGSGPAGLSGMPARARFADTEQLRPLLNEARESLLHWAQHQGLRWIEDESNQDDGYDRNFLRLRVLPLLAARWPHFAQATTRSAELCAEQEQLLDELLAEELASLVCDDGSLTIAPLRAMSAVRRAAMLRRWIAGHGGLMPSRALLNRLWDEVALAREDAAPRLRCGEAEIRRFKDRLWWVKCQPSLADQIIDWHRPFAPLLLPLGLGTLSLTANGDLRLPQSDEPVTVRFRASGTLHIVGRNGGRKIKKIWQELNVAPWLRDSTPLLFYGETLVAAAGVFVTLDGVDESGKGVQLEWKA